jgi:hypothetical protein
MTKHPCAGMTEAQRRDFELIATGQRPRGTVGTISALKKAGLIVDAGHKLVGKDRFGDIFIPEWAVPIPIHAQWCKWASENC